VDVVLTRARDEAVPAALEAVYRARHADFLRVATAITGNVELGRDAVQDGLARALAARRSFRRSGSLEAWLWKVIVNAARNVRRETRRPEPSNKQVTVCYLHREALVDEAARVREEVARLPERQRLVLFLRYYADLDYAAIARVLGVRRGTVAATLNHAHTAVRRSLEVEE
jgi:RNA polymerase sigma-70 factor (ECF subfamily)